VARARLTLGNYLGAVRQMVTAQDEATCFYGISDLHAMTTPHDPTKLRVLTREFQTLLLACGLDPERATLFQQSRVPTHTALAYLLECTAYTGELGRMIQFKEKRRAAGGVGTGTRVSLYTYPVLMAADILLYRPSLVPVGDDQRQHVELTRDLADPSRKMSKSAASEAGVIRLLDDRSASGARSAGRSPTPTPVRTRCGTIQGPSRGSAT